MWTPRGLQRFVVLFFIDLSTRRVQIGGIACQANGLWMVQIARNLTDAVDGFFTGKRYLIHDRDPLYTQEFLKMLAEAGIESVKLPPRSPNLNLNTTASRRTNRIQHYHRAQADPIRIRLSHDVAFGLHFVAYMILGTEIRDRIQVRQPEDLSAERLSR